MKSSRLINEIRHGEVIASKGEEVWHWSSPAGKVRFKRRSRMLKKFIGNKNKKVLELGCGTGIFTKEIAKTKNKIFAIDISSTLLRLAQKRVKAGNVKFILGNAYQTKFNDNYFDYIVGNSILHYLDIDLAIKEIYRLLKDGGGFIFTEPNMLNPQVALERKVPLMRKIANNSQDETAFIRWSIRKKLLKAGFYKLKIRPFDFLHPFTPASLIKTVNIMGKWLEKTPLVKEIGGSLVISGQKESD